MQKRISYQGEPGSYSHQACRESYPDYEALPYPTFAAAIEAVRRGDAELGMIGVENTTYGRVADVHSLLPASGLQIIGEAFVRVHINLLALPGTKLENVARVRCMSILFGQCADFLRQNNIDTLNWSDNAAAARDVAALGDPSEAALASELAAEIYGLDVLARHIEDQGNNTTRFLVMSRDPDLSRRGDSGMVTSFVFRVRNIPAALYKVMGGFATNGVNMTKLESYMLEGKFTATQFYAEIEGHPDDRNVQLALEEARYFTDHLDLLGVYAADPRRHQ